MLQSLAITFREGLESFLIIGIIVAYLRKTGRQGLLAGVSVGVVASILLAGGGAYAWLKAYQEGALFNQSLWEGIAMVVAAVLVATLLWQVQRMAKHMKGDIEARVEAAIRRGETGPGKNSTDTTGDIGTAPAHSLLAQTGVALVTILFVARELVEALFMVVGLAMGDHPAAVFTGGAIGLLLAGGYAWLWSRYGRRLGIGTVLKATTIFLVLFLVQLIVGGIHELAEGGVLPNAQAIHDATERFGPDGDIGQFYGYVVASIPLFVLAWSLVRLFRAHDDSAVGGSAAPLVTSGAAAISGKK